MSHNLFLIIEMIARYSAYVVLEAASHAGFHSRSQWLFILNIGQRWTTVGNDCIPFFLSVIVNDTYHISWHQWNEFEEFLSDRPHLD